MDQIMVAYSFNGIIHNYEKEKMTAKGKKHELISWT